MNTLGNKNNKNSIADVEEQFRLPATAINNEEGIPIWLGMLIGFVLHICLPMLISLILFLLAFLGLDLTQFKKPEPKVKDIEFVLVNQKEQTPINKNTKYRADRNTRAGGKHNPNKNVSPPEPMSRKSVAQSASSPAPRQKTVVQKNKPKVTKQPAKNVTKQVKQNNEPAKTIAKAPPKPVPNASPSKQLKPPTPKSFAVPAPVPKIKTPKSSSYTGGPVTSGPIGVSGSSSSAAPVMASGNGKSSSSKGKYNSAYSSGGGNPGNPSPGNPNGSPGIDAVKEPDFGPYMRDLQRKIKRNWDPPRGDQSKTVVLYFKVAKDGRLLSLKVARTSGSQQADKAALSAVELAAPFRPLPPEYRENDIDIQFTFDYNVINARMR